MVQNGLNGFEVTPFQGAAVPEQQFLAFQLARVESF
jgi:hypothetical protein